MSILSNLAYIHDCDDSYRLHLMCHFIFCTRHLPALSDNSLSDCLFKERVKYCGLVEGGTGKEVA